MEITVPSPPTAVATPSATRRKPWLAALLSLLLGDGLGHLYAGRARRGLFLAAALIVTLGVALHAGMVAPAPALRLLPLAAVVAVKLGIAWDAAAVAAAANRPGWVPRPYNRWYVYVAFLGVMFVVQSGVRTWLLEHVARAYTIPSTSMEPTVLRGDYILAAPFRAGRVSRGIPVVHQSDDGTDYISRVVGIPGDTLEMRERTLFVNGRPLREEYVQHVDPHSDPASDEMGWQREFLVRPAAAYSPSRDRWGPLVVPAAHYFVLGDNRDNAYDSRYLGFVSREQVVRRPVWIYLSRDADAGSLRAGRIGREIR